MAAAEELAEKKLAFSDAARGELSVLRDAVTEVLDTAREAFERGDVRLAMQVEPLEQVIDQLKESMRTRHIRRLQQGGCSIELGFILSDLLTGLERTSDHCSNIAVAVIELQHDALDSHRYLNEMKRDSDAFREMYVKFREKYTLPESAYIARQAAEYR